MKFGIIGTTPRAAGIARLLASSGAQINVSDPTDVARAEQLARELGTSATIPYTQAISSDVIVLAMSGPELAQTLRQLGPLRDKVVIDAMLPEGCAAQSAGESLARRLDNRHVVEAFVEPNLEPGSTIALCSDDPEARKLVAEIIRACGCTPNDLGPLSSAQRMERRSAA